MTHSVHLDNIKLQVEFYNSNDQHRVASEVIDALLSTYSYLHIKYNTNNITSGMLTHTIYTGGSKILEIKSGNYFIKSNRDNTKIPIYYISIEIAGLKQYNNNDKIANDCLIRTVAYFNTYNISFSYTGIDIAVDMQCPFINTYAFCNMKSASKRNYYKVNDLQPYLTTHYIEKYNNTHHSVMKRSYLYDKSFKSGNTTHCLTRFELKLQSKLFSRYPFKSAMLQEQLNKYHILYFPTLQEKDAALSLYAQHEDTIRRRDLHKLGLDKYRIVPDTSEIESFLIELYNVYEHDLDLPIMEVGNGFDFEDL